MINIKLSERLKRFLDTEPFALDGANWYKLRKLAVVMRLPYVVQTKSRHLEQLVPEIAHLTHVLETANRTERAGLAPQKSSKMTLPNEMELFLRTDFTIGYGTTQIELRYMAKILSLPEKITVKMALIEAVTAEVASIEYLLAGMVTPSWQQPESYTCHSTNQI